MKKICLIWKKESKGNQELASQIAKTLKAEGFSVLYEKNIKKADLIMPVGGDGTILRTVRILEGKKIPIIGVFAGGLGFLSEITQPELNNALVAIKSKKYFIDQRSGLIAKMYRGSKLVASGWALNDVALTKIGIARVLSFEVLVGGSYLGSFKADGAVVSSATGSTAYNLSLSGPILSPESPDLIFNPICSHSLAHRPVVTHAQVEIRITTANESALTLDGQTIHPLKMGDRIVVSASKPTAYFLRLKKYDLFEVLRLKMGWG